MKRVRWLCALCSVSVLGGTRPRKDDVTRFCLPCSATTGKLVPRTAPVLEAQRQDKTAKVRAKRATQADRERATRVARYTVDETDLRTALADAWRLPTALDWRARKGLPSTPPTLKIRRCKRVLGRLGFASLQRFLISVSVTETDRASHALATLLHEVAHILIWNVPGERSHGRAFQVCLRRLREEWSERYPLATLDPEDLKAEEFNK